MTVIYQWLDLIYFKSFRNCNNFGIIDNIQFFKININIILGSDQTDDNKQKLFLGWLAPRGIVTAAVASLFSIRLEQAGVLGAGKLQGLVFLTILMTVGIQGLTAQPLAKMLGLLDEDKDLDKSTNSGSIFTES